MNGQQGIDTKQALLMALNAGLAGHIGFLRQCGIPDPALVQLLLEHAAELISLIPDPKIRVESDLRSRKMLGEFVEAKRQQRQTTAGGIIVPDGARAN